MINVCLFVYFFIHVLISYTYVYKFLKMSLDDLVRQIKNVLAMVSHPLNTYKTQTGLGVLDLQELCQ